jgi:hypothetical protein
MTMAAQDLSSPYIDMWKDHEPDVGLQQRDAATREWVPSTGLTITFRYSLTEQGAAIGALTNIAATEAGIVGDRARYVGAVDLSLLTSEMPDGATYPHGTKVYLQVVKTGDIVVEAFEKTIRRTKYS